MSKMSWISHLCETNNRKELIKEVGIDMADGFLEAHKQMRDKRNQPVYKELNKMQQRIKNERHKAAVDKRVDPKKEYMEKIKGVSL